MKPTLNIGTKSDMGTPTPAIVRVRRDSEIKIRLTEAEHTDLSQRAKVAGKSISDFTRVLLGLAVRKRTPPLTPEQLTRRERRRQYRPVPPEAVAVPPVIAVPEQEPALPDVPLDVQPALPPLAPVTVNLSDLFRRR